MLVGVTRQYSFAQDWPRGLLYRVGNGQEYPQAQRWQMRNVEGLRGRLFACQSTQDHRSARSKGDRNSEGEQSARLVGRVREDLDGIPVDRLLASVRLPAAMGATHLQGEHLVFLPPLALL